jgi:hypothetical protein
MPPHRDLAVGAILGMIAVLLRPPPTMHRSPFALFAALSLTAFVAPPAAAQCTYSWPVAAFGTGGNDTVSALAVLANGDVVAGGRFTDMNGVAAARLARWNGAAWSAFGSGADGEVSAMLRMPNGDLVAGGAFQNVDGVGAKCVARWNGTTWSPLASGVDALALFGSTVQALAVLANGDLVIAGGFSSVSGVPCANIARWNGVAWSALGAGCNGVVRGLAVAPNGDLYATGAFVQAGGVVCNGIARWNGVAWSALGTGLGLFGGNSVAAVANGDVIVGGSFLTAGGGAAVRIARWNGAVWSALGAGANNLVTSLLVLPTGGLLAGGAFTTAGGVPCNGIALWNGASWQALAGGCNGMVSELALADDHGSVVAAGEFAVANGNAAGRIARVVSSCASTAVGAGAGCSGSGGPNVLTTTRLPMIGGQYRATVTGMPAFGVAASVVGFSATALPLPLLFPGQGLAGCTLWANPDVVDLLTPVAGAASVNYAFPANPVLIGASMIHQFGGVELDLSLAIVAVSSSNAFTVTLGGF